MPEFAVKTRPGCERSLAGRHSRDPPSCLQSYNADEPEARCNQMPAYKFEMMSHAKSYSSESAAWLGVEAENDENDENFVPARIGYGRVNRVFTW
nr:hypothetical protein CFP56_02494 [Quercus suber]